jgi:dTMP kinase
MMIAMFITFEGGEGSGKSTQAQLLKARLEDQGRRVIQLREPGGTKLGEDLRALLLSSSSIAPKTELLLFLAARSELVQKVIKPAIESGIDVICDRFIDSTAAYQGFGRGLDLALIDTLNDAAIDGCRPDLTILLDIDPDAGLARASERSSGDSIEGHWQRGMAFEQAESKSAGRRVGGRDKTFHRKVRKGYQTLAKREPERWLVLDATQSPDVLAASIWERAASVLQSARDDVQGNLEFQAT